MNCRKARSESLVGSRASLAPWEQGGEILHLDRFLDRSDAADRAPQHVRDPSVRGEDARLGDVEDSDQRVHERVELAERRRRVERNRDDSRPERPEEERNEVGAVGNDEGDAIALAQPERAQVRGAAPDFEVESVEVEEEILGGAAGRNEREALAVHALAGSNCVYHTDHGGPM